MSDVICQITNLIAIRPAFPRLHAHEGQYYYYERWLFTRMCMDDFHLQTTNEINFVVFRGSPHYNRCTFSLIVFVEIVGGAFLSVSRNGENDD